MSNQTSLSRESLKENRTIVPIKELKLWEQNPREVLDLEKVKEDMKGVQTVPLLVMSDGTVLGGNTRLLGMQAIGKPSVWVSVIEFEQEGGSVVAYINGERDIKTFKTIEDGMKHYALKNNSEYARYLDAEVVELALDSALDLSEYDIRSEDGQMVTWQDLMNESDGTTPENLEELEIESIKPEKKEAKPKIAFSLSFDPSLVRATSHKDFEDWLNGKMDEMMISMLDQFAELKAQYEATDNMPTL